MAKGRSTRSGLLWQVERLLTEVDELPQILLMENVPQVVGDKNMADFALWIKFLDGLGYRSKYKILNAKDYGVPQNRERCFMVSWLGDFYYDFPTKYPLRFSFRDALEDEVNSSYYLTDKLVDYFVQHSQDMEDAGNGFRFTPVSVETLEREREREAKTITTRSGSRMDDNFILMSESWICG